MLKISDKENLDKSQLVGDVMIHHAKNFEKLISAYFIVTHSFPGFEFLGLFMYCCHKISDPPF
jgi:hypothetical protein